MQKRYCFQDKKAGRSSFVRSPRCQRETDSPISQTEGGKCPSALPPNRFYFSKNLNLIITNSARPSPASSGPQANGVRGGVFPLGVLSQPYYQSLFGISAIILSFLYFLLLLLWIPVMVNNSFCCTFPHTVQKLGAGKAMWSAGSCRVSIRKCFPAIKRSGIWMCLKWFALFGERD